MLKDSASSTGHVGHFSKKKKKYVACKKSTLKVQMNLSFVKHLNIPKHLMNSMVVFAMMMIMYMYSLINNMAVMCIFIDK